MVGNDFSRAKLIAVALDRRRAVLDHLRAQIGLHDDSVAKIVEAGPKALQWYCEFEHDRWRKVVAARRRDVTLFLILTLAFSSGSIGSIFLAVWSPIPAATQGFITLFPVLTLFTVLAALIARRSGLDLANLRKDCHAQGAARALQTYGDSILLIGQRGIYSLYGAEGDRMTPQLLPPDQFGFVALEQFGDITAVNLASKSGAIHAQILFPPPVFDEAIAAVAAIENWSG